jgi:glucan 1,3-beta-glucosidase
VTTTAQPSSLAGGIILDNVKLSGVTTAVSTAAGATVFAGPGTGTIGLWAQGNVYSGTSGNPTYVQRSLNTVTKPSALLAGGSVFTRSRPQYETYAVSRKSLPFFVRINPVIVHHHRIHQRQVARRSW